jgi:hypothetical protein
VRTRAADFRDCNAGSLEVVEKFIGKGEATMSPLRWYSITYQDLKTGVVKTREVQADRAGDAWAALREDARDSGYQIKYVKMPKIALRT